MSLHYGNNEESNFLKLAQKRSELHELVFGAVQVPKSPLKYLF